MKNFLRTIALILLLSNTSYASHLMGGQMTSRNLGGLTYEVTLTVYRDTLGIPISIYEYFNYADSTTGWDTMRTVMVSAPVNIGNGVEMYTYIDTITFPASGQYEIWSENCCRNFAILNMSNPGSESFHLNNSLFADSSNSSPVFQNIPITVAQVNVPFSYNPLPTDADGDSISWVLDIPLSSNGANVLGYVLPFSDSLVPFTLDPVTGEITFLPNTLGNFVVSFRVNEYRNGTLIGFIRRDMQILIVPTVNQPLRLNLTSTNAPYSGKVYTVTPGSSFNFTCIAFDPDMVSPQIIAAGDAFNQANAPSFFVARAAAGTTTGTLSWTPDPSQARQNPYLISLRTSDAYGNYIFSNDVTLRVHVNTTTGIASNPANEAKLSVYPNPVTNGELSLNFHSNSASPVTIEIMSISGQTLRTIPDVVKSEGDHVVNIRDLSVASGIYLIRLTQDGKQIGAARFNVK